MMVHSSFKRSSLIICLLTVLSLTSGVLPATSELKEHDENLLWQKSYRRLNKNTSKKNGSSSSPTAKTGTAATTTINISTTTKGASTKSMELEAPSEIETPSDTETLTGSTTGSTATTTTTSASVKKGGYKPKGRKKGKGKYDKPASVVGVDGATREDSLCPIANPCLTCTFDGTKCICVENDLCIPEKPSN